MTSIPSGRLPAPTTRTSMEETPFTLATSRKKRKNKKTAVPVPFSVILQRTLDELENDRTWLTDFKAIVSDTVSSGANFKKKEIVVVCLGLGSPSSSRDARAQLALLVHLCEALSIDHSKISLYDPVFSDEDSSHFQELDMKIVEEEGSSTWIIDRQTIFFMPHCPMSLYEKVLRSNWTKARLQQMVIIGNDFSEYIASRPYRTFSAEYPCLSRIAAVLESKAIPTLESYFSAFNNTAIQHAKMPRDEPLDTRFWDLNTKETQKPQAEPKHSTEGHGGDLPIKVEEKPEPTGTETP